MENKRDSLLKNTTLMGVGTLCTKGIMFIMTPLITRWLPASEYGKFDLIITYAALLLPILTLASGEAIFRFTLDETNDHNRNKVLSTGFTINIIGATIVALICIFYLSQVKKNVLIVTSFFLYFVSEIFYNYIIVALRGAKKLSVYTVGNIIYVIGMALFVTIFVYILKLGLAGILLGYACGYLLSIILMVSVAKVPGDLRLKYVSVPTFKRMMSYSLPMIPNSISWWIVNVSDRSLIAMFLGTHFNGIYAVVNKIPSLCTTFFNVFHLSWQQSATEAMNDIDRDSYYSATMNRMFQVVASICIMLLGFNYWFFKLLFSEVYLNGQLQSPILVLAIVFSMLGQFIGGIYVAQMKSKKNGLTTGMAAITNVVINFVLIKKMGLFAASISTLVSYVVLFSVRMIDIRKEIKLTFNTRSYGIAALLLVFFINCYVPLEGVQIANCFLGFVVFGAVNYRYFSKFMKILSRKMISR